MKGTVTSTAATFQQLYFACVVVGKNINIFLPNGGETW